ncbi:SLC26A/SulP transporter family protein [Parahaliea aestuarii]|uniref:Cyclic nucleotide-binding domain-containing protein n=1 Tax=Parahaliea aestuarii TaxID=1852021 RepID=A0A5C8ZLA8_9GAMM|nr:SulP family inorganic anion transporter [Parahaliea aestuarii]TXS89366.1 cyclic nucleotide-binding domain-containing protein [Parahaliea aestuarii]
MESLGPKIVSEIEGRRSGRLADITGGLTASFVTLPKAMAYGALVFVPLGPDYVATGLMAGIISLAFGNLLSFRGGSPIVINSTLSLASLMLAALLAGLLERLANLPAEARQSLALSLLFLTIFLAGFFQVLAGLVKFGGLSRLIPRQVISGLINGVSVLIFLSQLPVLLGMPVGASLLDWSSEGGGWAPWNLLVGAITILGIVAGKRLPGPVPPVFTGIGLGCATFYLVQYLTGVAPGPLLGKLESGLPTPATGLAFLRLAPDFAGQLLYVLPYALGLAGVLSLWSLLFMASGDNRQGGRSNGNVELLSQGASNMLLACFGGVSVAGNSNTLVNYDNGGRTRVSRVSCGVFALAVLMFLGPLISHIPAVLLAGVLVVFSVQAIDPWSLRMARIAFGGGVESREALRDLCIMLLVLGILLGLGVLEAVAAGMGISLALFLLRMGQEIIRGDSNGTEVNSGAVRSHREQILLKARGRAIRLIEVEGALFFGTADTVADRIRQCAEQRAEYLVLDLRRITEVDATGAEMLSRMNTYCREAGQRLLLSGVDLRESDNAFLQRIGTLDNFEGHHFVYLNDALRFAEDQLLANALGSERYQSAIAFADFGLCRKLEAADVEVLRGYFHLTHYADGEALFFEDGDADTVFLLASGQVDVRVRVSNSADKTVQSICPGFLCGELGVLENRKRYGTAYARGEVQCYCMTQSSLSTLQRLAPDVAFKFLAGMSTELADRLAAKSRAMASKLYV